MKPLAFVRDRALRGTSPHTPLNVDIDVVDVGFTRRYVLPPNNLRRTPSEQQKYDEGA